MDDMRTLEEEQSGWCKTDTSPIYEDVSSLDPEKTPMAAVKDVRWPIGSTIYIRFLDGDSKYNERFKVIANQWVTGLANLKFHWLATGEQPPATVDALSIVRITLRNSAACVANNHSEGHWSKLGTGLHKQTDLRKPTMNIDMTDFLASSPDPNNDLAILNDGTYGHGTILHEFGHMLGLNHEQLRPDRTIQFDETKAFDYYRDHGNWTKDEVNFNVLRIEKGMVGTLQFDPHSIMMYWFPNAILTSTDPVAKKAKDEHKYQEKVPVYPENNVLSTMDKEWIKIFYPADNHEVLLHEIDKP